jgi:hypothetical protein
LLAICVSAVLIVGCSDGRPKRVKVSGHVTIDGAPLKYGSVLFVPEQGRPAGAGLDEQGHFELTTYEKGDGIIPGNYKVQIKGTEAIGETAQRWHAPVKYSKTESSGIEYDIQEPTYSLLIELSWDGGKPFVQKF